MFLCCGVVASEGFVVGQALVGCGKTGVDFKRLKHERVRLQPITFGVAKVTSGDDCDWVCRFGCGPPIRFLSFFVELALTQKAVDLELTAAAICGVCLISGCGQVSGL